MHKFQKRETYFLVLLSIINIIFLYWISKYALTEFPNTGDESSLLFQAKIFSHFHLWADLPPLSEFFQSHYLGMQNGKWFSLYPPVYPMFLALGIFTGRALLAVALCSSGILLLLFYLVKRIYKSAALAWTVTILFWLSPSFLLHSASYYNHIGATVILLAILNLIFYIEATKKVELLWLVSILFGLGFGIRPYTFFLLFIPISFYMVVYLRKESLLNPRPLLLAIMPVCVGLLLLYLHGAYLTGSFTEIPYLVAGNNVHKLLLSNFSVDGWLRIIKMTMETLRWLFAFGYFKSGGLPGQLSEDIDLSAIILCIIFAAAAWDFKTNLSTRRHTILFSALVFFLILGHVFYSSRNGRFGERFFFEITFILILFFARFFQKVLQMKLNKYKMLFILIFLIAVIIPRVGFYLPGTLAQYREMNQKRMDVFIQASRQNISDALIFIRDVDDLDSTFYVQNEPDLSGNIFARDLDDDNKSLMKIFPKKNKYIYLHNNDDKFVLEKIIE